MDILVATLQDLKTLRPDLCDQLYGEFLKAHSISNSNKKGEKPIVVLQNMEMSSNLVTHYVGIIQKKKVLLWDLSLLMG